VILAVVPARGGSKGLPGKNLRPLAGLSLLGHAVHLSERCPSLAATVVSTDDRAIADEAARLGVDVLIRPAELARDETPMWPVLQHALATLDADGSRYSALVLIDPTSPLRLPEDVERAVALLESRADADGVVSVSRPHFEIVWQSVVTGEDGVLEPLVPGSARYVRRQDVPAALFVNGGVYAWRSAFVRGADDDWLRGRNLALETPGLRARTIDTEEDLAVCEALLAAGVVRLPWLQS
jgi:CMP-N,N'-diacetyllegionaminic acid synthase